MRVVDNENNATAEVIFDGHATASATALKTTPPRRRAELVERGRLVDLLASWGDLKVIEICAPAGSGKSVLAAQWRAEHAAGRPIAWVSLDRDDNDVRSFWAAVALGVAELSPHFEGLRGIGGFRGDLRRRLLPRLADALIADGRRAVLILDRLDVVENPECLRQLEYFIDLLPPTIQLVLVTRTRYRLPLSRLRAAGDMAELEGTDLAFDLAEIDHLIRDVGGVVLGADELADLHFRTEGWPTGVLLAARSLRQAPDPAAFVAQFRGSDRRVADYFQEEVMSRLPMELRHFLLRISLLEQFCAPLCDALLGTRNAASVLDRLERDNLFVVSLAEHRRWFRLQRLFKEYLQSELARTEPALVPLLHARAGRWCADHGFVTHGIGHALDAGRPEEAIRLLTHHWADHLGSGAVAEVGKWIDAIGSEQIKTDAVAAICAAWVSAAVGDRHRIRHWLETANVLLTRATLPNDCPSVETSAALIEGGFGFNGTRRMLQAAAAGVELAQDRMSEWYAMARRNLGYARYLVGRCESAVVPLDEALSTPAVTPIVRITALSVLSLAQASLGHDAEADDLAQAAMAAAKEHGFPEVKEISLPYTASGAVLARAGALDEARAELEHAVRLCRYPAGLSPWPALDALSRLAAVCRDLGDQASARLHIEQARSLRVRMPPDRDRVHSELEQIEERIAMDHPPLPGEPLTGRQREVLRLLSTSDLSLREIGDRLYVSINTVKAHSRAIYCKLGVRSREEAALLARKQRLL